MWAESTNDVQSCLLRLVHLVSGSKKMCEYSKYPISALICRPKSLGPQCIVINTQIIAKQDDLNRARRADFLNSCEPQHDIGFLTRAADVSCGRCHIRSVFTYFI